ncbi:MAG: ADOP family duplicated permease [Bryobacteraceae bacterium]
MRLFRKKRTVDDELREEIEFHLRMRTGLNEREGMTAGAAREAARRQFGNATRIQEEARRMQINEFLETLMQDLCYAARSFRRTPGFTFAAVFAIALGIGATTAMFSVVDRILFRGLPYAHEDRLVWLGMGAPIGRNEFLLGPDYLEWRDAQTPFEAFTSSHGENDCDITENEPVRARCGRVEWTFLPTLGIHPALGRNFTREEDSPNAPRVGLLSYGLWQSRFGGNPTAIGKALRVDGDPITVVGVLPRDFEMPSLARVDLLLPQALDEAAQRKREIMAMVMVFARLKPGVALAQAEAALQPLFERALQFVPPQFRKEVKLKVSALRDRQVRDARLASWILLGSVVCVLLISCANVANLLLARAASRQRENAVRAAIGAPRARLIRQMLTESLLLSVMGAFAGLLLAHGLLRALVAIAPEGIPRLAQAGLDLRVLLFGFAGSALCGILFGLAPALQRPRVEALTGWRVAGGRPKRLRHLLVTGQLAVSLVLLTAAGLLLQSLWKLQNVRLGMSPESVMTVALSLNPHRYPQPPQQRAFLEALEARLAGLPGTASVAFADSVPPGGRSMVTIYSRIAVEGRPDTRSAGTGGMVVGRKVTPGYFSVLRIPILRGRAFREEDRLSGTGTIILSESLARRMFPNENPLGKRIRPGVDGQWGEVIGIAGDVKNAGLIGKDDPEYYEPMIFTAARGRRRANVIIRSAIQFLELTDEIQSLHGVQIIARLLSPAKQVRALQKLLALGAAAGPR